MELLAEIIDRLHARIKPYKQVLIVIGVAEDTQEQLIRMFVGTPSEVCLWSRRVCEPKRRSRHAFHCCVEVTAVPRPLPRPRPRLLPP